MKVTQFAKPVDVKSTTRVEKTITVKVNKFAEPVNVKSWVSRCPIGSTAPRVNKFVKVKVQFMKSEQE